MGTMTFHAQVRHGRFRQHALAMAEAGLGRIWRLLDGAARSGAESDLTLGRRLAAETRQARALERRYRESDPGFANDLAAAVMRHESAVRADVPRQA